MRITGLTTRLIEIDPRPRYRDGVVPPGRPSLWQFPLLTVHTDEGIDGYSTGYGPHGDGPAIVDALHAVYSAELVGRDPLASERIWQGIWQKQRHLYHQRDSLLGVIDVALWDIRGKVAGLPIVGLLGLHHERMACYATARSDRYTVDETFAEASAIKAEGFHGYKVQFGDGPAADIPRLRAAREAVGPNFALMHDPNGAYSYSEALAVGAVLDELDFRWFEEPLPDHSHTMLGLLATKVRTPLLLGETVRLTELAAYLRSGVTALIRGDTLLKGGITGLRKATLAAELFGVGMEIHVTDSPLLDIANLHVSGASANTGLVENDHPFFRWGIKNNPLEADSHGYVSVPTAPGLGVDLDHDWLDDHTGAVRSTSL